MFLFTLIIILAMFTFDIILDVLNYKHRNKPVPANVKDVYNEEEYKKWHQYTMEVFKLNIITKVIKTIILLMFLAFQWYPKLVGVANNMTENVILQSLLFLGLYTMISYLVGIGFNIYRTFNIEERYGFNKTTTKTFITDQIKSMLLTIILGGALLFLILTLFDNLGLTAIIYAWIIVITITLLINVLYTRVFIKLFNKVTPLEEGELYDKVKVLASDLGYGIKSISVMDASKRSTRLNAFFSGFGRFKSIVLYDTLIEKCSTDEIISVLAHEIGHAKYKDTLRGLLIGFVQMAVYLSVLAFFLSSTSFAQAFGFEGIHYGFAFILFTILIEPIGLLQSAPLSALSRKAEYRADKVAVDAGYKEAMISALKVLARENFANLTPHPLLVKLTYSHPPITQRIEAINKTQTK